MKHTLRHEDRTRHYTMHAPPGPDRPLPLVVMLHGAGGTAEVSEKATGWGAKGIAEGFLVCFPQALAPKPDEPVSFLKNPSVWRKTDVPFLDAVLDDVCANYSVDGARIYLSGFSNGGSFSFTAGAALSHRVAAIGCVSGKQWSQRVEMARPVPAIYMVGTDDPLNPIDGGDIVAPWGELFQHPPVWDGLRTWAATLGCPQQPETTADGPVRIDRFGPGAEGSELLVCTIEGAGHHWPGGVPVLNEKLAGKPTDALRATDVIWGFFSRFARGAQAKV